MFFLLAVAMCVACGLLLSGHRPRKRFLSEVATLLDGPEFVAGVENTLAGRAFLKGAFHGRKVVVLVENARGEDSSSNLVISMETHAAVVMDSYSFTGDRLDREADHALFDLEVKHEFVLRHDEGCLKAKWVPQKISSVFNFSFPANFDMQKCVSVLEAMHTLAASIERRAGVVLSTRSLARD